MFGIKVVGRIAVLDPETGEVIPPVSVVLDSRFATVKEAEAKIEMLKRNNPCRLVREVVEVAA